MKKNGINEKNGYEAPRIVDVIIIPVTPLLGESNLEPIEGGDDPYINW